MRDALLRMLARAGALRAAYRAYEGARALRPRRRTLDAADGLPVPPPRFIVKVAGTPDVEWFLESGRAAARSISASLERNGRRLDELRSILDFGCGCGRVIRHWRDLPGQVHGTDRDEQLVEWCRAHLGFARFETNALAPPLPYADASFDLVYALSVLTHLPENLQARWMSELARVVRPGGLVLVTTHGHRYRERLTAEERRRFDAGDLVVRWSEAAGTNLCTAFHPERYVRERLAREFLVEEFIPEGAAGNPHQDLVLLRRP